MMMRWEVWPLPTTRHPSRNGGVSGATLIEYVASWPWDVRSGAAKALGKSIYLLSRTVEWECIK